MQKIDKKEMIESVFERDGEVKGFKKTLVNMPGKRFKYAIVHESAFGNSSELYEDLDEAIYDFIALENARRTHD